MANGERSHATYKRAVFSIICEKIPSNVLCFWKRVVRSFIVRAGSKRSASPTIYTLFAHEKEVKRFLPTSIGRWEAKGLASNNQWGEKRSISLPYPQYIDFFSGGRCDTFRFHTHFWCLFRDKALISFLWNNRMFQSLNNLRNGSSNKCTVNVLIS